MFDLLVKSGLRIPLAKDFVEPYSEQLDLWTGRFDTDAVYAQTAILRDDSIDNTNVTTTQGHGGSFKLMSGDPETDIADE